MDLLARLYKDKIREEFVSNLYEVYGIEGEFEIVDKLPGDKSIYEVNCIDCGSNVEIETGEHLIMKLTTKHECETAAKMGEVGINNIKTRCIPSEWGEDDDYLLIMHRLKGTVASLWDELDEDQQEILERKIYDKIEHMHEIDIGHGDVHEGNILLDEELEPYIIDWETAYHISTGKDDPTIRQQMIDSRMDDFTYEQYVDADNWMWKQDLRIKGTS